MNQKFKKTSSLLFILCLIVSMFAESAYTELYKIMTTKLEEV